MKHFDDFAQMIREGNNEALKNELKSSYVPSIGGVDTLVHIAVDENNLEALQYLHSIGVDLNGLDRTGNSPLHLAALHDKIECIDTLLGLGADINRLGSTGKPPIVSAIERHQKNAAEKLLAAGADVNVVIEGTSILHEAIEWHDRIKTGDDIVLKILEAGAYLDEKAKNYGNEEPLAHAADKQEWGVVKALFSKKVNPNADADYSPLHMAVAARNEEIIKLCLANKADPAKVQSDKLSASHIGMFKDIQDEMLHTNANWQDNQEL